MLGLYGNNDIFKKKYSKKTPLLDEIKNTNYTKEEKGDNKIRVKRFTSEGNLSTVTSVMENIQKLINVGMDRDLQFCVAHSDAKLILPSITYEVVSRELNEKSPLSMSKVNNIKEIVDGELTGDSFEIYVGWYDCIVEFNIYGLNKSDSIDIQEKFEDLLELYKGHLKKIGLSNLNFVKEISSQEALRDKRYVGSTLIYYMELQKIKSVRTSSLKNVGIKIQDKIKEDNPNVDFIFDELTSKNKLL